MLRRTAQSLSLAVLVWAVARPPEAGAQCSAPRTALVLSGGGARGAAHVGVLKVLERLRVPVDFIVDVPLLRSPMSA